MIESDPSLIKELQCTQQARKRSLNFFRRNPDKPKQTEKKWLSRDTCTSSFAFGRSSALNCDCITLVICRPLISGTVGESTEVPLEGSVYYILVSSLTYKFFYCFCLFFSSSWSAEFCISKTTNSKVRQKYAVFFYYNTVDETEFFFLFFCSKSSAVVIDNNILDDIQVIEPEIQSSDQELYQVSQSQVFFFVCLLRRYSSLLWISVATWVTAHLPLPWTKY